MCGLVGLAGDLVYKDEEYLKRLLILDYFRGTDSTGLAAIAPDGGARIAKAAVDPITFFDMKAFETACDAFKSTAFIGHNRAATLGAVNAANAHPFQFGDITGAHNGTLDKESWKRLERESGALTSVDSEAIFACINEIGLEETIKLMETGRNSSTGAWALTYYNKADNTINFINNGHRPLWYAFNEKKDKIIWASEWPMMNGAAQLTKGWDEWLADDEGFTFFPFEPDYHYSLDLEALTAGLNQGEMDSFKGEKIEGRKPAPLVATAPLAQKSGGAAPWQTSKSTTYTTASNNSKVHTQPSRWNDDKIEDIGGRGHYPEPEVETIPRTSEDPLGGYITEDEFTDMVRYGCGWCGSDVSIEDKGMTIYATEGIVLCKNCTNREDENLKMYLPPCNSLVVN